MVRLIQQYESNSKVRAVFFFMAKFMNVSYLRHTYRYERNWYKNVESSLNSFIYYYSLHVHWYMQADKKEQKTHEWNALALPACVIYIIQS